MKKLILIFIAVMFCSFYGTGQNLPARMSTVDGFIPEGWTVIDRCRCDFNGDGYSDFILAVQSPDTVAAKNSLLKPYTPKLVIVGLYDPVENNYELVEFSREFLNPDNMLFFSNKLESVSCNKNGFIFFAFDSSYSGGTSIISHTIYTFQYRNRRFELIYKDSESNHYVSGTTNIITSIDFVKGTVLIRRVEDTSGKKKKSSVKKRFKLKSLLSLSNVTEESINEVLED